MFLGLQQRFKHSMRWMAPFDRTGDLRDDERSEV